MKSQTSVRRGAVGLMVMAAFAFAAPGFAAAIQVSVDTSDFAGDPATVLFDFTAGGGTPDNTVTISDVVTSFIFNETDTGAVTGTMPTSETLSDSAFFSESDLSVILGNTFTFDFSSTNVAPDPGAFPDEFAFYILNFVTGQTLPASTDPTGAESLVTIDLTGDPTPVVSIYSNLLATGPVPTDPAGSTAPEPSTTALVSAFLILPLLSRRVRRQLRRAAPAAAGVVSLAAVSLASSPAQAGILTGVGQDANLSISFSGLRLNRTFNTFVTIASITNNSSSAINGPFYVGITNVSNSDVTLSNGSGNVQDGYPYAQVSGVETIEPLQTVTTTLSFNNPDMVAFTIQAKVYDAASAPPVATLQCPQPAGGLFGLLVYQNDPTPMTYTPPTDSLGRVASCVPASGTGITENTTVTCMSSGGVSQPASCSFTQTVQQAITVVYPPPPPPQPPFVADLALIPCSGIAALLVPGQAVPTGVNIAQWCVATSQSPAGQVNFTIWNYGPNPAINASITLSFAPGMTQDAWQFSQPATCQAPVSTAYPFTLLGIIGGYHIGYTETCSFANIPPNTGVDVTAGEDVPSGWEAPNIQATLAVDPTQNIDNDTGDMAISVPPSAGPPQSITVPVSISERITQQSGCNYSNEPGFAILLNTCGVPTAVTSGLVAGFLGAAAMLTGAGEAYIINYGTENIVFQSLGEVGFID